MNTLVILHGWGSCAANWQEVKQTLEKNGFQVLVPALPGFGSSPPPKEKWFVSDYVEWVKDFCEGQAVSQFFLFGHSFGGRLAIKFAAHYPQKLKGLILCAAAGIKKKATFRDRIVKMLVSIFTFFKMDKCPCCRFLRKVFYRCVLRRTDYLRAQGIMREVFKNVIAEDLTPYLSQIKVPALILWGKEDKMTPVKDAHSMHQEIPNSQLKVFEGVGHSLRRENPKLLIKEIKEFISSV